MIFMSATTTQDYCERQGVTVHTAVDVACSAGVSTRCLADRFPAAQIQGIDLSSPFLALAELRRRYVSFTVSLLWLHNKSCKQWSRMHAPASVPVSQMLLVILGVSDCRQADPATPAASTSYLHANAEAMPLDDRSQDMVAASYLVHELPVIGTKGFLHESYRVLKPGGVIAIVDGDPW